MSVITAEEIVNFVVNAKNAGWGYVYSGQGELYTPALAQAWANENRAGKSSDYFLNQCSRWFNRIVVDCSGLIIQAFRSKKTNYTDQTANTLLANSMPKGDIATIPEQPGICVWRKGHIGIYIGEGHVIESGGTNIGVVVSEIKTPATNKAWTNWGMLADADYSQVPAPVVSPDSPSCWLGRVFKLTDPYMRDDDIAQLQKALKIVGFSPGKIDGVFGPLTQKAVMEFQKKAGLVADGVVGEKTTAALKGVWVTDYQGNCCCPLQETQLESFNLSRLLKIASPYMQGSDVRDVQYALELHELSPGTLDGVFGNKTRSAVVMFQQNNQLLADGIVGRKTAVKLGGIWTGN